MYICMYFLQSLKYVYVYIYTLYLPTTMRIYAYIYARMPPPPHMYPRFVLELCGMVVVSLQTYPFSTILDHMQHEVQFTVRFDQCLYYYGYTQRSVIPTQITLFISRRLTMSESKLYQVHYSCGSLRVSYYSHYCILARPVKVNVLIVDSHVYSHFDTV